MLLPLNPDMITLFGLMSLGGYLLICSTILFFKPRILYGIREVFPEQAVSADLEKKDDPVKVYSLSLEKKREYQQKIDLHITQHLSFLRKGYSSKDMAAETGIPLHHLSAVINQEYGMNFSDFINRYRVEYIKQKLSQPEWRHLTLEGIALEAGFTNRITFFRAFTKLTGITPSEYIAQLSTPADL
jgi:AraC-like DNA-binding protein